MKTITLMISLLILNVTTAQPVNASEVAQGQGRYIYTYSMIANLIGERNAETDALSAALSKIMEKCMDENFDLIDVNFFLKGMNKGYITVNADVEFVCK